MAEIDTVVAVSVVADSASITRLGFGTSYILTYHTVFADQFRVYTGLAAMVTDGFATTSQTYLAAKAAFDQDPACESVIVGRLPTAPSFVKQLTMTSSTTGEIVKMKVICPEAGTITDPVVAGGTISPTGAVLAGQVVTITYTIPGASTTTTVATAVEQLVEAVAGINSASALAVISATPVTAGKQMYFYDLEKCTIAETTAAAGYDTELTSVELNPDVPDFYFVETDSQSSANILAVGAWVKSRTKMYFAASQSSGLLAGTDTIGSDLLALSNDRVALIYSKNAQEYAGVAWATVVGVQDPGSITAAMKTLESVTPSGINSTQKAALEIDNVNHYMQIRNLKATRPGKVTSGEWIDIRHGIDALTARIQEDVFNLIHGRGKVPFTTAGFTLIQSAIDAACQAFVGTDNEPGLLVKDSIRVVMPAVSSISSADKALRRLTGVKFYADLQGAIHYVSIAGTVRS